MFKDKEQWWEGVKGALGFREWGKEEEMREHGSGQGRYSEWEREREREREVIKK